jgi:hypothetical protein
MKKLIAVGLVTLFMIGCKLSSENYRTVKVSTAVNQIEQVADDLSITVKGVNDSRCPYGCQCIWAGEVKVLITIKDSNNSVDTSLVLPSRPRLQFTNYNIVLESVKPYPICNDSNIPTYSFYFRIDDISK